MQQEEKIILDVLARERHRRELLQASRGSGGGMRANEARSGTRKDNSKLALVPTPVIKELELMDNNSTRGELTREELITQNLQEIFLVYCR
jgi:hypothetical protein